MPPVANRTAPSETVPTSRPTRTPEPIDQGSAEAPNDLELEVEISPLPPAQEQDAERVNAVRVSLTEAMTEGDESAVDPAVEPPGARGRTATVEAADQPAGEAAVPGSEPSGSGIPGGWVVENPEAEVMVIDDFQPDANGASHGSTVAATMVAEGVEAEEIAPWQLGSAEGPEGPADLFRTQVVNLLEGTSEALEVVVNDPDTQVRVVNQSQGVSPESVWDFVEAGVNSTPELAQAFFADFGLDPARPQLKSWRRRPWRVGSRNWLPTLKSRPPGPVSNKPQPS